MRIASLRVLFSYAAAIAACSDDGAASGEHGSSEGSVTGDSSGASTTATTSAADTTVASSDGSESGDTGDEPPSDACSDLPSPHPDVQQALPERWVDTTYVEPTGATIAVAAGGDLQAALDAAQPGDVITLEAGASFTGPFTLPSKAGEDYVVVRTATPDADLPAPGTRVGPDDAALMPKLLAPDMLPAIATAPGAHHFRFVGVEVAPVDASAQIYVLVSFGDGAMSDAADVPHHLILDRSYIHGTPTGYTKRGVQVDCSDCAVIDSHVADCHAEGQDAQAIAGFNGPGPIKIVNDYLEGSGENVIFGGADSAIPDLVPSDIEIRRNHFYKPLTWKVDDPSYAGTHWSVKNLLELKNAARVLIRCNVLENNWADAQVGFAILLTPRNQDGGAPWSGVADITIQDNILRHTASGINIAGEDDLHPSTQTARIVVRNNLLYDVDRTAFGGDGRAFQVISPGMPVDGLAIEHNTTFVEGNAALVMGDTTAVAIGLGFRDNISTHGDYGVFGSGAGEGTGALDMFAPGYAFTGNVLIGFPEASYPAGNFFPAAVADVGFVDASADDYRLMPGSMFAGAAEDGTDVGADVEAIVTATNGVAP